MRESDAILAADLREAGLDHLAERAERSEWNDYFGVHDMPQHALIAELRSTGMPRATRERLVANVVEGKYDGTTAESQEWAASPEGREVFSQFPGGSGFFKGGN